MSETLKEATVPVQTSSAVDSRAKTCQWRENVKESLENAAVCSLSWLESWMKQDLNTLSGRMFPDFSPAKAEGTSRPSSARWPTSGIVEPGGCWTVSTSEWPSNGTDSLLVLLREILDGDVPVRYYLSAKAAGGVLRRSEERNRPVPMMLRTALRAVNGSDLNPHPKHLLPNEQEPSAVHQDEVVATCQTQRTLPMDTWFESDKLEHCKPETSKELETNTSAKENWCVRRLTPLECERLQAFPDGWTIPNASLKTQEKK